MLFFYYGEDSFRAKQKIDALKHKFRQTIDKSGHNIHYLDETNFSLENFFNLVKAQGFLASKKLIIIRDILDLPDLKEFEEPISEWLKTQKGSIDENYLIFWQTDVPKKSGSLYKQLAKAQYVQEFQPLEGAKLNTWVANLAKQWGCSIKAEALQLLIALVGNDGWQLNNEIHKLAHQGQPTITVEMVKNLVTAKTSDVIFELIDACAQRNKPLAHRLISQQLNNGLEPLYLLSMIVRQFRLLTKAHELASKTNNSYALADSLKIHPYVAKKILSQVRNYNQQQLINIYQQLINTDSRLKYAAREKDAAFTLLIEKI